MEKSIFDYKRKSYILIGEIFFWTATINQWKHLLGTDPCHYKYSTCNYYKVGEKTYTFIKDLRDEF